MTTTTMTVAQWHRRYAIADDIRGALGFTAGSGRWREIYPCTFVVAFYCGTYKEYDGIHLRYSTDWIDLADFFQQTGQPL